MESEIEFGQYSDVELLEITVAALMDGDLQTDELWRLFNRLLQSRVDHNISVLHNLGLICIKCQRWDETAAFVEDFIDSGDWGSATALACSAYEKSPDNKRLRFWNLINGLAKRGHFQARGFLFDKKVNRVGLLALPLRVLYRLVLLPRILVLVIKNRHDERLSAVPGAIERHTR